MNAKYNHSSEIVVCRDFLQRKLRSSNILLKDVEANNT